MLDLEHGSGCARGKCVSRGLRNKPTASCKYSNGRRCASKSAGRAANVRRACCGTKPRQAANTLTVVGARAIGRSRGKCASRVLRNKATASCRNSGDSALVTSSAGCPCRAVRVRAGSSTRLITHAFDRRNARHGSGQRDCGASSMIDRPGRASYNARRNWLARGQAVCGVGRCVRNVITR